MALALAIRRDPAVFDHPGGQAEVTPEMGTFRGNVTAVDIDHHGLHPQHIGGFGLTGCRDRAGDHMDSGAFAPGPIGEGRELARCCGVGVDPDIMRPTLT